MLYLVFFKKEGTQLSEKRRDLKNRILKKGETQRKDGKYCYKYTDEKGEIHFLYSWKLTKSDPLPQGKRECIPLREQIQEIEKKRLLYGGVITSKLTVEKLLEILKNESTNRRVGTLQLLNYHVGVIKKEKDFCRTPINKVNVVDAKNVIKTIQEKYGFCYGSTSSIKCVLHRAFAIAVENGWVYKNPFEFKLDSIVQHTKSSREGLSVEEQTYVLDFIKNSKYYNKYFDMITIFFGTGLRLSELLGLTVNDVDFDNRLISVNKQLHSYGNKLRIGEPKTQSSYRSIPMTKDVENALNRCIQRTEKFRSSEVDGVSDFIFLNKYHQPYRREMIITLFTRITNSIKVNTGRDIKISAHICRHTFCSNMVRRGMNPKVLQNIMGHSNIRTTYDVYTRLQIDDISKEMQRVVG